jgi:hypothetical protein
MGAKYATTGQEDGVGASYTTALHITASTSTRGRAYDFMVGASGTPADNSLVWTIMRFTVAPTSSSVTPTAIDPGEPAAQLAAGENATAEGTVTSGSEVLELPINQRASYRWVAAPGGEIVIPASSGNGISARVKSAGYTGAAEATFHHEE